MASIQRLDNNTHRYVRIRSGYGANLWPPHQMVPVVPSEFASASGCYPIFLTKQGTTGLFEFSVLLGIATGENLFIDAAGNWDGYVPLNVRRHPFGISTRSEGLTASERRNLITIDLESPRVSDREGDLIFSERGGHGVILQRANAALAALFDGTSQSAQLTELLLEFDLVEPIQVSAALDSGEVFKFEALYTVNEERLRALPDQVAGEFSRSGAFKLIYLQLQSLQKFDALVALKSRRATSARIETR